MAQKSERILALTGLRGVSVLFVFLVHAWDICTKPSWVRFGVDWLSPIAGWGPWIDMYMVLSAFVLFLPICSRPEGTRGWDWKRYAERRARRMLLPYYATLLLVLILMGVFGIRTPSSGPVLETLFRQLWTHLLLVHTFFVDTADGMLPSLWYVGLEVQFYLVFPLLVWAWWRWGVRSLWAVAGLGLAYRLAMSVWLVHATPAEQVLPSINVLGRAMVFTAGMGAALIVAQCRRGERLWSDGRSVVCTAAGLLINHLARLLMERRGWAEPLGDTMLGVGMALVVIALAAWPPGWGNKALSHPWLVYLGVISFSFYLVHQPVLMVVAAEMPRLFPVQMLVALGTVGLALTLLVSVGFYQFVEQPFNRPRVEQPPGSGLWQATAP